MKVLAILLLLVYPLQSIAQKIKPHKLIRLSSAIRESSGLAISHNCLWTINDSGGSNSLIEILSPDSVNKKSNCDSLVVLQNAANIDWEDLTTDEDDKIYVGDFGNNLNKRHNLVIYKCTIPEMDSVKGSIDSVTATTINFSYSDQHSFPPVPSNWNYDCEAFFHLDDSLYLFSKNSSNPNSGYTKLYKLPDRPGNHVAQLVDSFFLNEPVTGAAISPDHKTVVLLTYFSLWVFRDFNGAKFFSGKSYHFPLKGFTQKEAITFHTNDQLYLTDERNLKGGKLYSIDLSEINLKQSTTKKKPPFLERAAYDLVNNPQKAYRRIMKKTGS